MGARASARRVALERGAGLSQPSPMKGLQGQVLTFVVLAKGGTWRVTARLCQNQDFSGLVGFSGFHFVRLAVFAIAGDSAKTNMDKRLSVKDEPDES